MFIKSTVLYGLLFLSNSGITLAATVSNTELDRVQVVGKEASTGLGLTQESSAANRLNLSILETPASVESLSKEDIAKKADYSSLSAVTRSTGFASTATPGNGGMAMSVRGFEGHGSVVQLYDGSRLYVGAGAVTFPADTWTLEKVDVLRGPGSVTNGVGAVGGTVNYIPKKPIFSDQQNEINITAGSFGLRRLALGSGGELTSNLAYRLDAVSHKSDGYVDRADEKRDVIAGSLLFIPRDDVEVIVSMNYADVEAAPYFGTPLVGGKIQNNTRTHNYNVEDGLVEYKDIWPRMNVKWRLNENVTLTNDLYYMEAERHWRNVESYNYNPVTGSVDRQDYLEILHDQSQLGNRASVTVDARFLNIGNTVNLGFEVNSIEFEHQNNRPYMGGSTVELGQPDVGQWADGVLSETSKDFSSDTLQYAVFVDDKIAFENNVSVVAGLRQDVIDYKRNDVERSNGEVVSKIKDEYKSTSWRLGVVYQPIDTASVYIQTSRSVDPLQSIITSTKTDLKLAEGEQIEVGVKQSLWQDQLQYSLAFYDIEKKNLLSSAPSGVKHQVGKQASQGVELDVYAKPTEQWDIEFNISLVDVEYKTFKKGDSLENLAGNRPKNIPKITSNLWSGWQVANQWRLGGGARYVAERYSDDENTRKIPSYLIYDASVQWQVRPEMKINLHAKNLSDEKDYALASYGNQWILGDGRSYQISLNYQF